MYVTSKQACQFFDVSDTTLRRWADQGIVKYILTKGGHRRFLIEPKSDSSIPITTTVTATEHEKTKIIYARVSSGKQRDDLKRQSEYLKSRYPDYKLITDIGSGINYERPGFKRILEGVFKGNISTVVVAHKDRFTRFGYELFEWIFQLHGATLIYTQEQQKTPKEELSDDLMAIITVFSARYHGQRKYKDSLL